MFAVILTAAAATVAMIAAWIFDARTFNKGEKLGRMAGWAGIITLIALFVIAGMVVGVDPAEMPVRGINL